MESAFGYLGSEPCEGFLGSGIKLIGNCAAAVGAYSGDIGEVEGIIIAPGVAGAKIALFTGFKAGDTFCKQAFQFCCPFKGVVRSTTGLEAGSDNG
jgi:hypothetical protein